ncbi:MAG: nuclear transport factor 2 family protein [Dehalococcoidia bacterium]
MKADPKTEATVMNVVKKWFEAFAQQDIDGVMEFLAPDPDVVVIGTGGDEKCIGLAEIKAVSERFFSQFDDASFRIGWHSVSAAGSVAWVAADIVFNLRAGRQEISMPLRETAVLEKRGDRWLVVQSHDSLPAAGQKEGQAFPT